MKILTLLSALFFSISFATAQPGVKAPPVVYQNVTVVDTEAGTALPARSVLVSEGRIVGVFSEEEEIPNFRIARKVDCEGKYMIPGLWDSHIHLFQSGGLYTRPDAIDLRHRVPYDSNQAQIRKNIDDYYKRYTACGITGVIDCGGPDWNFDERINNRYHNPAPELFVTGPLITPWMPEVYKRPESPFTLVSSPGEAVREVQRQLNFDPDFIKIWYIAGRPDPAEKNFNMVQAVCDAAHKAGKPVWVHATELETAKLAVKAGADVLVHLPVDKKVDREFLDLVREHEVAIIPTMFVFESYSAVFSKRIDLLPIEHRYGNPYEIGTFFDMHELDDFEIGDRVRSRVKNADETAVTSPIILHNMKAVSDAGITVAAGTDAGNIGVLHGPSLFHEFRLMEKAGLSPDEILKSATYNAAKLLSHEKHFGSIKADMSADFVLLNSNPLEDIKNTEDINLVCKSGMVYSPDELVKPSPEDLAQMQLNAYNERDIEAFLAPYADDVEIYTFPNELIYKGKEQMRERYTDYFEKAGPKLHCKLVDRLVYGNYVFDREELTTGIEGREHFTGQAIYEIQDGKIKKVWFIK